MQAAITDSPHGSVYVGLKDKVVIITGASSGIGAGCAEVFAVLGSKVVLCGRNVGNLQQTAEKCEQLGLSQDKILQVPGDVTKQEDLEETVKKTLEKFGRIDVVVANAGIVVPGSVEQLTLEGYRKQMDVNLTSVFSLIQLTLPELRKTRGNIIAISSVAALRQFPMCTAYCMSKSGLDQLIQCVALEQAPHGVRANCVNPGMIYTNIFKLSELLGKDNAADFEAINAIAAKGHPLGRCGNVFETGKAIAFLASNDASFITGVTLRVDGGNFMAGPDFESFFSQ